MTRNRNHILFPPHKHLYIATHHPDHKVGEDSNPDSGQNEGHHEVFLPARLGTVGDGEVQQQQQRPRDQPLEFAADSPCSRKIHEFKYVSGMAAFAFTSFSASIALVKRILMLLHLSSAINTESFFKKYIYTDTVLRGFS